MQPILLPVNKIKLMNSKEIEQAHAITFKALHEGMYKGVPQGQLEILKTNFSNLDSIVKSGYLL